MTRIDIDEIGLAACENGFVNRDGVVVNPHIVQRLLDLDFDVVVREGKTHRWDDLNGRVAVLGGGAVHANRVIGHLVVFDGGRAKIGTVRSHEWSTVPSDEAGHVEVFGSLRTAKVISDGRVEVHEGGRARIDEIAWHGAFLVEYSGKIFVAKICVGARSCVVRGGAEAVIGELAEADSLALLGKAFIGEIVTDDERGEWAPTVEVTIMMAPEALMERLGL